jgi:hypothetical protein
MDEGLNGVIAQLERQKTAIEHALAALRDVEGIGAPASAASASGVPAKRRGRPKGTGRPMAVGSARSEGQKKRWAEKKAAEAAPAATPQKAAPRKRQFTPQGLEKLAKAMRQRWAVKRAAAAAKKTTRKKRAATKAA